MSIYKKGIYYCTCLLAQIFSLIIFSEICLAGPPFLSDDPYLTQYKHVEIYLFGFFNQTTLSTYLLLPALELDYGLSKQIQLHLIVPVATYWPPPKLGQRASGLGDSEFNVKIRLLEESKYCPEIAFEPTLEIPTGNFDRNLSNGKMWMKMPIWIGKKWDTWLTYGGIGYAINPAAHTGNYFFGGWVLQKNFAQQLSLGAEIYSQGRSANTHLPFFRDYGSFTLLNLGLQYQIQPNFLLLFSGGHSLIGTKQWVSYLGLYWNLDFSKGIVSCA